MIKFSKKILSILLVLIIWEVLYELFFSNNFFVTSPLKLWNILTYKSNVIFEHTMYTVVEVVVGVILSFCLASMLALLLDQSTRIKEKVFNKLVILQTIPLIILAPLISNILGFGVGSKVFIVVLVSFFTLLVSLVEGFTNIPVEYYLLFEVMDTKKWQLYYYLKIPFAIPYLYNGLKIVLTYAVSSTVIAEYMGSQMGLGIYLSRAYSNFRMDEVWLITIIVACLTLILLKILDIVKDKFFAKYFN